MLAQKEDASIDVKAFHQWATSIASSESMHIYRIKGMLNVQGDSRVYVFQGVCGELRGVFHRPWGEGEARVCDLVVIGKGLDEGEIRKGFDTTLHKAQ